MAPQQGQYCGLLITASLSWCRIMQAWLCDRPKSEEEVSRDRGSQVEVQSSFTMWVRRPSRRTFVRKSWISFDSCVHFHGIWGVITGLYWRLRLRPTFTKDPWLTWGQTSPKRPSTATSNERVTWPAILTRRAADSSEPKPEKAVVVPLQVGFSRLFCDIHCVRDAVIRGDRTILRNLEQANC